MYTKIKVFVHKIYMSAGWGCMCVKESEWVYFSKETISISPKLKI